MLRFRLRAHAAVGLTTAALALWLAAACARPHPEPDPPDEPAPVELAEPAALDPAMEATELCVDDVHGFAVEHPAGWFTNPDDVLTPCALFHPEPFEVPRNAEIPIDLAVMIDVEPVPIETISGDVLGRVDLARGETTVAGHHAVRVESETTGEGLHEPGIRTYQYFVELADDRTLVAATYDAGELDFQRKRRILDAMMATLAFVELR
jgi:hypothetical protein